ncbi:MAG: hypothetical protein R3E53_16370 [Myxococcota bacterium]
MAVGRAVAVGLAATLLCLRRPLAEFRDGSLADALPAHIKPFAEGIETAGLRPAWHSSGRRLLHLDALVGDVRVRARRGSRAR